MLDSTQERLERALEAPDPYLALRSLVRNRFREGLSTEELYEEFTEFLPILRARENHEQQ